VLDLAPNGELFHFMRREGTLRIDQVRFVAAEIINILEYMNIKGLAHRDLKPANLLLDENFHLKLIDFGTSKVIDRTTYRKTAR